MARSPRRRRVTPKSSWLVDPDASVNDEVSVGTKALLEALNTHIDKQKILTLIAPTQMQALNQSGEYKTIPITATDEMTFSNARMGKRGKIIFAFEPVEPGDHKQLELDEARVAAVRDFESMAKRALGASEEQIATRSFSELAGAYMKSVKKHIEAEKQHAIEAEKRKQMEMHSKDPNWGLF
jgi:hypothetical protein